MSNVISSGQITITDINDIPALSSFITSSKGVNQIYDNSTSSYTPSYLDEEQVLSLHVTKAGTNESVLSNIEGKVRWYRYEGSTKALISSTNPDSEYYLSGDYNEILHVKKNISLNSMSIMFESSAVWKDSDNGNKLDVLSNITLTVTKILQEASVLNVYGGKGTIFFNDTPSFLTIDADLYTGGTLSNKDKIFNFYYADSTVTSQSSQGYDALAGLGWHLCDGSNSAYSPSVPANTATSGQASLTVLGSGVVNTQYFKVICKYEDSVLFNIITLLDYSDPIQILIESTGGSTFKNSTGSTILIAKVIRQGVPLDEGSENLYTYTWFKRLSNGELDSSFSASGKTIQVLASDISTKATYICEVSKND